MADILQEADDIRAEAEKSKKSFDEKREQLKRKAENAWEDTIDLVRRYPSKALGITLGTGFALGIVAIALSRRRETSAAGHLRGLASSGADAWVKVRDGFSDAVETLKCAVDDATSQFK
jgi:hypothetical protein